MSQQQHRTVLYLRLTRRKRVRKFSQLVEGNLSLEGETHIIRTSAAALADVAAGLVAGVGRTGWRRRTAASSRTAAWSTWKTTAAPRTMTRTL